MRVPDTLAQLGHVLDLRVEERGKRFTLEWRRGSMLLCSDETRRSLWLVPAPKGRGRKLTRDARTAEVDRAARVHKAWSAFEAGTLRGVTVALGRPQRIGRVVSIAYRSDKWDGQAKDYEHEVEGRAVLVQLGDVWRISGGGLSVTPAGITG